MEETQTLCKCTSPSLPSEGLVTIYNCSLSTVPYYLRPIHLYCGLSDLSATLTLMKPSPV